MKLSDIAGPVRVISDEQEPLISRGVAPELDILTNLKNISATIGDLAYDEKELLATILAILDQDRYRQSWLALAILHAIETQLVALANTVTD